MSDVKSDVIGFLAKMIKSSKTVSTYSIVDYNVSSP